LVAELENESKAKDLLTKQKTKLETDLEEIQIQLQAKDSTLQKVEGGKKKIEQQLKTTQKVLFSETTKKQTKEQTLEQVQKESTEFKSKLQLEIQNKQQLEQEKKKT